MGRPPALAARALLCLALAGAAPALGDCVARAERAYALPEGVLLAISRVERGGLGVGWVNGDGSADLGPWQVNTVHLPAAAALLGRSERWVEGRLTRSICFGAAMAGWVLASRMAEAARTGRSLEWAIGAYHSRTPARNAAYADRVLAAWRD